MPFGVLGLIAAGALGSWTLGILLLMAAFFNRVAQSVVVGWGVIGDSRALRYCWLYPARDLMGFLIWLASFTSRTFLWRGEIYRFDDGGKIIPQHRPAVNAVVTRL